MVEKVFGKKFLGDVFEVLISRDIFLRCEVEMVEIEGEKGTIGVKKVLPEGENEAPRLAGRSFFSYISSRRIG